MGSGWARWARWGRVGIFIALLILPPLGGDAARGAGPWEKEVLRVGVLEEPRTLNLWLASDAWSNKVLKLIYDSLYEREPNSLKLVPWLAASDPVYDAARQTYTVKLRPAKWSDGSDFTAEDVVFTAELIKDLKIPRYLAYFSFIKKVRAPDPATVVFELASPKAIFATRTLRTPIVQKKQWAPVVAEAKKAKQPLNRLLRFRVDQPVGTGPFTLQEWKKGTFLYLTRNPHFFGQGQEIAGHKLGPFIQGILFKQYGTSDAAILGLRKGDIDVYDANIQPGYLRQIEQDQNLKVFLSERSALYYLGFNLRRPPFNDLAFRRAVAALVDTGFIIQRVLQGAGQPMLSVVPAGNATYYNPRVDRHCQDLCREDRARRAYEILKAAGYSWERPPVDQTGKLDLPAEGLKTPNGQPMAPFVILTPPADYDPNRAMAGMLIQEWLRDLGIPAQARGRSFGSLMEDVKSRHEFDAFVLGYGSLNLDPGYLRTFFHSDQDKLKGWNMSGFRDPEFDRLAVASESAMDEDERRRMVLAMQDILMREVPVYPLYNPLLVEAVRADRFVGWVPMLEGIDNIWSYCELKPAGR